MPTKNEKIISTVVNIYLVFYSIICCLLLTALVLTIGLVITSWRDWSDKGAILLFFVTNTVLISTAIVGIPLLFKRLMEKTTFNSAYLAKFIKFQRYVYGFGIFYLIAIMILRIIFP